jgi:hypothetical protein
LSWSTVPIPTNGNSAICVLNGTPLSFERRSLSSSLTSSQKEAMMRLSHGETLAATPVVVRWMPTVEKAPWPPQLTVLDGGRYYAVPNFTGPTQIELKLIDKASVDGNQVLPILYSKRCFEQISHEQS